MAGGKQMLREEHYEIAEAVAAGDSLALQVRRTGVVAVRLDALKPGDWTASRTFCRGGVGRLPGIAAADCAIGNKQKRRGPGGATPSIG